MRINTPVGQAVDKMGSLTLIFKTWVQQVSRLSIIEGKGSPEGNEAAMRSRQYHDINGGTGTSMYIKKVDSIGGDKKLGWILQ